MLVRPGSILQKIHAEEAALERFADFKRRLNQVGPRGMIAPFYP